MNFESHASHMDKGPVRTTQKQRAEKLHERATKAVKMHKWSEKELVVVFHELDTFGGYRFYGAKNLFDYAIRIQKLSDAVAMNIINVARKSREVPAIKEAVVNGTISMSAARKIVPVITKESAEAWIELAATSSVREVERAVAEAKPELHVQESAKFVTKDRLKVVLSLDEEAYDKLKRVMDLESQRKQSAVGQGDAVVAALDAYLEKHDPLLKAERVRDRKLEKISKANQAQVLKPETNQVSLAKHITKNNAAAPVTGQVNSSVVQSGEFSPATHSKIKEEAPVIIKRKRAASEQRPAYPAALTQAIDLRDGCRCTHLDEDGERCEERRWLHYHHVIERANGGRDTLENMVTLCSGHHRMAHCHPKRSTIKNPIAIYH